MKKDINEQSIIIYDKEKGVPEPDYKLDNDILKKVLIDGDLSKLNTDQLLLYQTKLCETLGLNPLTKPFEYLILQGKKVLYARKDCTEQLRKIHGISITKLEGKLIGDEVYSATAYARARDGREDVSTGAVSVKGLRGDSYANAVMKAETKAKRRVTLSLGGLGILDESELETIPELNKKGLPKELLNDPEITEVDVAFLENEIKTKFDESTTLESLKDSFTKALIHYPKFKNEIIKLKDIRKLELEKNIVKENKEWVNDFDKLGNLEPNQTLGGFDPNHPGEGV
jgi:hypothetical protein